MLFRLVAIALSISSVAGHAAPPSLDAFFDGAQIREVSLSPDGNWLSMIVLADGKSFVAVKNRNDTAAAAPILAPNDQDGFEPSWCTWANNERLVCSFRGRERDKYIGKVFPVTRLVAVNRDGGKRKMLLQSQFAPSGQLNDRIIDWTPEDPETVLIEKYHPRVGLRVLKLNVYDGEANLYESPHSYIGGFGTDGHGNVRLGWGVVDLKYYFHARLEGEKKWRELARVRVLSSDEGYRPIAVIPKTNYAYAMRDKDGRSALWKIDLTDKEDPQLMFASSRVDVRTVYTRDNRVLAVLPESGMRDALIVEPAAEVLGQVLAKLFKDKQYYIRDASQDFKVAVISAESDVRAPEFFVLDMSTPQAKLQRVGSSFPGLDKTELAPTTVLTYPARDGTPIPAYLTKPVGIGDALPPLIVLPHGGPWAREYQGFDSWVQMLARDGYAVLQMNYRGSAGYGKAWREASYRDWSGLPYADMVDGLDWALKNKHGDPQRVCVVGGSFGGYLALAAAVRDSPRLKCVISVAGVSDLRELSSDVGYFANWRIAQDMIGKNKEKLAADSPRLHAATIAVPVLLVHGREDWTVEPDQSEMMAKALTQANKPFRMVMIEDTDHYFTTPGPQRQLFSTLSEFLAAQLAPPAR
jgi:dipeptidyl aminopeptidase/acylaminoacyl peptidase